MTPGKLDITIYRGATWEIKVTAKDKAQADINFEETYTKFLMQIRPPWVTQSKGSQSPLLELSSIGDNPRITQSDPTTLNLEISSKDTAALTFDSGRYELELIIDDPDNPDAVPIVDKIIAGSVSVMGEVTK